MYYRFTKLAKAIIIFNVIITILLGAMHINNINRMYKSNELVNRVMEERQIDRNTTILALRKEGHDLYLDKEFTAYFGVIVSSLTLIFSFIYAKSNSVLSTFLLAFSSMFTSLIGGILIFYIVFSGKSETYTRGGPISFKNEWERFIHHRNTESVETYE